MAKALKQQPEFTLQKQVCNYLRLQYPNVLFMSDTIASLKLTVGQMARNKAIQKAGFHCPDLLIFEPRVFYKGLFIELKAKNIYKLNGELLKNEHVENQAKTIEILNKKGYKSHFAIGFEEAKTIIDNYLK